MGGVLYMNSVRTGKAAFCKSVRRASLASSICCFSERRFLSEREGGREGGRGEREREGGERMGEREGVM